MTASHIHPGLFCAPSRAPRLAGSAASRAGWRALIRVSVCVLAFAAARSASAATAMDNNGNMLLIHRSLHVEPVQLTELDDRVLVYLDTDDAWQRLSPSDVIALIDEAAGVNRRATGLAILADGQQIPGKVAVGEQTDSKGFHWHHKDMGVIDLPLESLSALYIDRDAVIPPVGESDVLVLSNGDVRTGFILELGDPVVIEQTGPDGGINEIRIPLDRVTALRIINPEKHSNQTRVWLTDGTVTDVDSIAVQQEDGYVRMRTPWSQTDSQRGELLVRMEEIGAILLNPGHMTPLASLRPTRVEGPATRFAIPPPRILNAADAPLGLAEIEYRGPLTAHYALPADANRFAAQAVLPESARTWGDLELIIRVDGDIAARATLNAEMTEAAIAFDVDGSELTIELLEGANGPVQDQVLLRRAMIGLGE